MLADIVVLAQAWKKSHSYIRRHNWYADVLDLDASTIDLESRLLQWATELKKPRFRPNKLLLVPAPKNARWSFRTMPEVDARNAASVPRRRVNSDPDFDDWSPRNEPQAKSQASDAYTSQPAQNLRPLAHLSIRDQTLATAVMMCLADCVETAQGDTTQADSVMRRNGVVSFGNRLHCTWVESSSKHRMRAKFSWGNSRTYRQYFQDYRAFLSRPRRICVERAPQLGEGRELFVISLDIKGFFDSVDRKALLSELRLIEREHREAHGLPSTFAADELFWNRATRIFNWQWRDEDHKHAELMGVTPKIKLGLPQGLVASGFFANAYLIRFDFEMNSASTRKKVIADDVSILDYCRYVDDMRVVVEAKVGTGAPSQSEVLERVEDYVTSVLRAHCNEIGAHVVMKLSRSKSDITPYSAISAQSGTSVLMESLNAELSGTFDIESLTQAAGGLDGLLWMSEQIEIADEPKRSRLALATIAVPNTDVRDDTVKRFAAIRLAQLMRQRLAMTDVQSPAELSPSLSEHVTEGAVLSHEFESTARKLIKCWAENPALALLLRCGLDLYPHPRLLGPAIEALGVKLFLRRNRRLDAAQTREVKVAEYVLADLLRAGVTETGFREKEEYPEGTDIEGYREHLAVVARRILNERPNSPWYLRQQARLYLVFKGDMSQDVSLDEDPLLIPYMELHDAASYKTPNGADLPELLPFALVAQQLHPNGVRFAAWLVEGLRHTRDRSIRASVIQTVALNRPDLLLFALSKKVIFPWRSFVPDSLLELSLHSSDSNRKKRSTKTSWSLLRHMTHPDNALGQENGLLVFAAALLRYPGIEKHLSSGLSPAEIVLRCEDWDRINAIPESTSFMSIRLIKHGEQPHPLYATPPWVDIKHAWLYGMGRVLRAALTGEFDFTTRRFLVTGESGRYAGLRSTWFNRRFGLLNSGHGLMDEPSPVSPWLSALLSALLRWPGVEFRSSIATAAGNVQSASELLEIVTARMAVQRSLFGNRSNSPMYVVPTDDHAPLENRPLRLVIVQPMRPRQGEFNTKAPASWSAGVLAEHRRHLAEVCRLTHQKLRTWASARSGLRLGNSESRPVVDVVLFPELAVHPEHVFLLRRLSDMLKATIFTGLTFQNSVKAGGLVNQGLWLIRTESAGHGRSFQYVWQGKRHPTKTEVKMGIKGHRPHVTLLELPIGNKSRTRIAAAICYDATDLDLVADLRDRSYVFLVSALNQDVQTFDNMIAALHFHMYQPVVLANSGEFGGSTAQVPLPKHDRLIAHVHGNSQVAVSVFEVDPSLFKSASPVKTTREVKSPPAGYKGRPK